MKMKRGIDFKELNRIKKKILEEVKLIDRTNFGDIKTVAGFDLVFQNESITCVGVILDINTLEIIEEKQTTNEITMNYYPDLIAFRDGPSIVNTIKGFQTKPDLLVIEGNGIFHLQKLGLATYIGVISNIPSIGINTKLVFGRLEEDKIMFDGKLVGFAIKNKDFANPVYVTLGNDISIETAINVMKRISKDHKMPEPLHEAHSIAVKLKRVSNA